MVVISYLGETILAVHLTVEEGLKLKIAMKGGLGGKLKRVLCRPSSVPFLFHTTGISHNANLHFHIKFHNETFHPRSLFFRQQLSPLL